MNLYSYVGNNSIGFVDRNGLAAKKTIIFWGEDYLSHEYTRFGGTDNFKLKAEEYKKYLALNYGYKEENILVLDGTTFEKWQDALKNNGKIERIIYYGHGDDTALYLSDGTPDVLSDNSTSLRTLFAPNNSKLYSYSDGTSDNYISKLNSDNSKGAVIELFSCNSASSKLIIEDDNYMTPTKAFSDAFHGIGIGATGNVNFTGGDIGMVNYIPYIKEGNWKLYK